MPVFNALIRTARKSSGRTQENVAEATGLSRRTIVELERGGGSVGSLVAVMTALDFRMAGLPNGETIGARVNTARQRRGWTIEVMAERAGVSPETVVQIVTDAPGALVSSLEKVLSTVADMSKIRDTRYYGAKLLGGQRDVRFTPSDIFDPIELACGPFDLDPCGGRESPVRARRFYYEEDDGLSQPWSGRVWCNPPYSETSKWLRKAFAEIDVGRVSRAVFLLRNRTFGRDWTELLNARTHTLLLHRRLKFGGMSTGAGFGNMLCVYGYDALVIRALFKGFPSTHVPPQEEFIEDVRLTGTR